MLKLIISTVLVFFHLQQSEGLKMNYLSKLKTAFPSAMIGYFLSIQNHPLIDTKIPTFSVEKVSAEEENTLQAQLKALQALQNNMQKDMQEV